MSDIYTNNVKYYTTVFFTVLGIAFCTILLYKGWQDAMVRHKIAESMNDVAWTHTIVETNVNVYGQVLTKVQVGLRRDGVVVWKEVKDDWRELNSDRSHLWFEETK